MPRLTAAQVASATGGRLVGADAEATTLVADSRDAGPGVAFAAVAGGHSFVGDALASGAPFVVVERQDALVAGSTGIIVDDVVRALMKLAASVRDRLDVPVVGVTGSTGKTLTKDFLAAALGVSFRVHATPKSYNAELGVPLTLFRAPEGTDALVLELAARHTGEIAELCRIVRPTSGVITGIGTSHIEEFGSREAIARTKSELLASLPPDGTAFVPSTDDYLHVLSASTSARVVTVGPGGHIRYRAERVDDQGRTHGAIAIGGRTVQIVLPVAGRALVRNAALAVAVASVYGVDPAAAADAISSCRPSAWRMELVTFDGRTMVNDAYNANPTSVASSLRAVRELAGARPAWAVLGQMAELGDTAEAEHRRVGALAAALGYEGLVIVGKEASLVADAFEAAAPDRHAIRVGSLADAVREVRERVPSEAVIVVKASRVAGLERLVELVRTAGGTSEDDRAAQVG